MGKYRYPRLEQGFGVSGKIGVCPPSLALSRRNVSDEILSAGTGSAVARFAIALFALRSRSHCPSYTATVRVKQFINFLAGVLR